MKILAINGSPRKDGNSAAMRKSWVDGVKSAYGDAEFQLNGFKETLATMTQDAGE